MLMALAKFFHERWYWDHEKRQVTVWQDVRQLDFKLDIRNFFVNPRNEELQQIIQVLKQDSSAPYYEVLMVKACVWWVQHNIISKPDKKENWQLPFETLAKKTGDCEDKAILLANLIRASGVEDWRVRLNAGVTNAGEHVWVTYFDGQKWIPLDFIACEYKEVYFSWYAQKAFTKKENVEKWKE